MALKKSLVLTSNLGDQVTVDCYVRVKDARTEKKATNFQYEILKDDAQFLIETRQGFFEPDMKDTAENIWSQCYGYLKSLPEFANAIDC